MAKFVDSLPIPPVLRPTNGALTIDAKEFETKLHRDLPPIRVWGYNGSLPGPTIEVQSGRPLDVQWRNQLTKHVFPVPNGAESDDPDVRIVTHLHGAAVSQPELLDRKNNNDGWPEAWITNGETQHTRYPNDHSARLLWYHDHAMMTTGRNVAAGLYGAYILRDQAEAALNLPSGDFEVPLVLSSVDVKEDGTLQYTDNIGNEFFGNAVIVNGKIWPYLEVEPRKYRFRIVNAANARTFALKLLDVNGSMPGPAFYQIGSDGGFLEKPVVLNAPSLPAPANQRLILMSSERADVIIDFAQSAGKTFLLQNTAQDAGASIIIHDVMQIRVTKPLSGPDTSAVPVQMASIPRINPESASQTRRIVFDRMTMPDGSLMMTLNGKHWSDPVEESPTLGSTEVWELVNPLIDMHPFHMHLVEYQVVDRRLFDVEKFLQSGQLVYSGNPVPPNPNEMGWKDTVRVYPQMVTRIAMRFAPFTGHYVYHCHILEHEDMEMMRPFDVVAAPTRP